MTYLFKVYSIAIMLLAAGCCLPKNVAEGPADSVDKSLVDPFDHILKVAWLTIEMHSDNHKDEAKQAAIDSAYGLWIKEKVNLPLDFNRQKAYDWFSTREVLLTCLEVCPKNKYASEMVFAIESIYLLLYYSNLPNEQERMIRLFERMEILPAAPLFGPDSHESKESGSALNMEFKDDAPSVDAKSHTPKP